MPFFSWQCISFQLAHREVDLVIKNEKQQNNFVKFLIYKLNTIDGKKNSAERILNALNAQDMKLYDHSQDSEEHVFQKQNRQDLVSTVMAKVMLKN